MADCAPIGTVSENIAPIEAMVSAREICGRAVMNAPGFRDWKELHRINNRSPSDSQRCILRQWAILAETEPLHDREPCLFRCVSALGRSHRARRGSGGLLEGAIEDGL